MREGDLGVKELFFDILGELSLSEIASNLKLMEIAESLGLILAGREA